MSRSTAKTPDVQAHPKPCGATLASQIGFAWINLDQPPPRSAAFTPLQRKTTQPANPTLCARPPNWDLSLGISLDIGHCVIGHFRTHLPHSNFQGSPFEICQLSKNHRPRVARKPPAH